MEFMCFPRFELSGWKFIIAFMVCQAKQRVYVGLSGGVDSAVSAALLEQATPNNFSKLFGRQTPNGFSGYDVTGVFIKIWSPEWTECTSKDDRLDAMRVCVHLGVPFMEIDLTKEYKREVVDYMLREYSTGRTPNPDVMCNRFIKFGAFFKWAIKNGAHFVATGHYARKKFIADSFQLIASRDKAKDQSYFLWTLTQEQLAKTIFPVGDLKKTQVRVLAKKFKLPNAEKKDSQGLCFVGHLDIKEFLSRYVPKRRGHVLNEHGKIIGYHDGAHFLTIGERHGFTINADSRRFDADRRGNVLPYYVVAKNAENNTITVASNRNSYDISYDSVVLSDTNWISGNAPDSNKKYEAQIRYHGRRYPCRVIGNGTRVVFDATPDAIAFGQSLVVYEGDVCLGGGVMEKSK